MNLIKFSVTEHEADIICKALMVFKSALENSRWLFYEDSRKTFQDIDKLHKEVLTIYFKICRIANDSYVQE